MIVVDYLRYMTATHHDHEAPSPKIVAGGGEARVGGKRWVRRALSGRWDRRCGVRVRALVNLGAALGVVGNFDAFPRAKVSIHHAER
jgi:hypothetical protein